MARVKESEGTINSMEYKRAEKSKAQNALQVAKSLKRPCRRASNSECEFSRELKKRDEPLIIDDSLNMLTSRQAAKYLNTSLGNVQAHKKNGNLKSTKIKGKLFFELSEIERFDKECIRRTHHQNMK